MLLSQSAGSRRVALDGEAVWSRLTTASRRRAGAPIGRLGVGSRRPQLKLEETQEWDDDGPPCRGSGRTFTGLSLSAFRVCLPRRTGAVRRDDVPTVAA